MNTTIEELMAAALAAGEEQRRAALRALKGEDPAPPAPPARPEPFMSMRQVADALNLTPTSLWRWQVPGHKLGGQRRFRLSEIEAYLHSPEFERLAERLKVERRLLREARAANAPRARGGRS